MDINELLYKFANNQASPENLREFSAYLETLDLDEYQMLLTQYGDIVQSVSACEPASAELFGIISRRIKMAEAEEVQSLAPLHRIHFIRKSWIRYAAAAVILFAIATTYFVVTNKDRTPPQSIAQIDIKAPQSNKARITLGNGQTINLDTLANGKTIEVDGVQLTKLADGRIVYAGDPSIITAAIYNTATNPRGSKVMDLELSDHSHVWLNAGSSITYPVAFTGNNRQVTITGEAYFEVAHDASHPFIVSKGNTTVQVLGTHFNVKAYDNDLDLKVTLLEGSVNVKEKNAKQILKPGQQAVVRDEHIELKTEVDVTATTAWLHGKTVLESVSLEEVLREIERWYDIKTDILSKRGSDDTFFARISRDAPLSEMLKTLEQNNVKYEFDANTRKLIIQ